MRTPASASHIASTSTQHFSTTATHLDILRKSGLPLVSCLRSARDRSCYGPRWGTENFYDPEICIGRGSLPLHLGKVSVVEYVLPNPLCIGTVVYGKTRMRATRRRSGKCARDDHPVRDVFLQCCAALTSARCLALQVNTSVNFGWPVRWTLDHATFFVPGGGGDTIQYYTYNDIKDCSVWTCTRDEGIQWCAPHWNRLYHCGAVPTSDDLRLHFDSSQWHAEAIDFKYDPWNDPRSAVTQSC